MTVYQRLQCLGRHHDWRSGCRCARCGKVAPPHRLGTQHTWEDNECRCSACGYTASLLGAGSNRHTLDGCRCSACGQVFPPSGYGYSSRHTWNGCRCSICGQTAPPGEQAHAFKPETHRCSECGKTAPARDPVHTWVKCGSRCSGCDVKALKHWNATVVSQGTDSEEYEVWLGGHSSTDTTWYDVVTYRCEDCGDEWTSRENGRSAIHGATG